MSTIDKIRQLKEQKNVVILAHYYVDGEVQAAADFVGDSYALARKATQVEQENIVFAGVTFMGESAKLLNPAKHVYMVDDSAGCRMADMITVPQIRDVHNQYPEAAIVCYVNSTAEVKAESDVCVTSSNAVRVVSRLPQKQIYFIPDNHLAHFVAKSLPDKEFIYHDGFCPTHQMIRPEDVLAVKREHPDAPVLAHPECTEEMLELADYIGSTSEIISYAREHAAKEYIIATEIGVFYQLETENSEKKFYPVTDCQVCPNMKKVSLIKLVHVLEELEQRDEIVLEDWLMERARLPLERMLELAK